MKRDGCKPGDIYIGKKCIDKKRIERAEHFARYVRDPYNKGRDIQATLGSFGVTFIDDIRDMINDLKLIGENKIADDLKTLDKRFVDTNHHYRDKDWWK